MGEAGKALQRALTQVRPARSWREAASRAGVEVRRGVPDDWTDPPEDRALPPLVGWPEEVRRLAVEAYAEVYADLLGPGERHEIRWPPEGRLLSAGAWHLTAPEQCGEHGEDYDPDCQECAECDREPSYVVDEPAWWQWHVTVERWGAGGTLFGDEQLLAEDRWPLGVTETDPGEVEYGPPAGSPERQMLGMALRP